MACMPAERDLNTSGSSSSSDSEDEAKGGCGLFVSDRRKMWSAWNKEVLKIYFCNRLPEHTCSIFTLQEIVECMNEWRGKNPENSSVPEFILVETGGKGCDRHTRSTPDAYGCDMSIRFSRNNDTMIGIDCSQVKISMKLNLNYNCYNNSEQNRTHMRYTILHETGHALGFYHEHQHPTVPDDLFIEDIVISCIKRKQKTRFYYNNFTRLQCDDLSMVHPFDRDSVMMYRMEKRWINERYLNNSNFENKFFKFEEGEEEFIPESEKRGILTDKDLESAEKFYRAERERESAASSDNGNLNST